ncbi:MAG: hypothetical protein FWD17_11455 [Polyangiaceae bacterium]|nr:hypothetical protein [Polyangiaceae bacterium]
MTVASAGGAASAASAELVEDLGSPGDEPVLVELLLLEWALVEPVALEPFVPLVTLESLRDSEPPSAFPPHATALAHMMAQTHNQGVCVTTRESAQRSIPMPGSWRHAPRFFTAVQVMAGNQPESAERGAGTGTFARPSALPGHPMRRPMLATMDPEAYVATGALADDQQRAERLLYELASDLRFVAVEEATRDLHIRALEIKGAVAHWAELRPDDRTREETCDEIVALQARTQAVLGPRVLPIDRGTRAAIQRMARASAGGAKRGGR